MKTQNCSHLTHHLEDTDLRGYRLGYTEHQKCSKRNLRNHKNRKLQTRLPRMNQEKLHLDKAILGKQQKQKEYYDAKTKPLLPLGEGSTVRINREKSWDSLAQVVKRADSPRSYILQDEAGKILRRNRRDLLHTNEEFTVERVHTIQETMI